MIKRQQLALPVIVVAQWFGTSLWFSLNGVAPALQRDIGIDATALGHLTLAVQIGFILGTLALAISGLADRFRASRIFLAACLAGAFVNLGTILFAEHSLALMVMRFMTGLCLAGIYPLGMKLVIGWSPRHTGATLAWLVGMLTLGTAMPHLLRGTTLALPWAWTLLLSSALAMIGGLAVGWLGDGPHLPASSSRTSLTQGVTAFRNRTFRSVAGGYFGHCWELYAFWLLVPFLVAREVERLSISAGWMPWLSFSVMALGMPGCIIAGRMSRRFGSGPVANGALAISGSLCLLYPLLGSLPPILLLCLLGLWGLSVIADSAQFSSLASRAAPREQVGATLAVMNAIGFSLTLPGMWLGSTLWAELGLNVLWWLLPGPVLGLWFMRGLASGGGTSMCRD